ncbi:MAG TPA: glycosyltransferase [Solirubrobacteraceae bacterium]|nr:glycosyltransferase [Solirubrobacteraceae bacterium]
MATVAFFPEGAYGPTNNCAGIGAVLRERGHRVVFIVEESFAGTLKARGFEERLIRLGPPSEQEEVPGQFWKDFIRDTAPVFRRPTIEQLELFIAPTFKALIDGARYVDDRLRAIFDELGPDVIVEDNVVAFPALEASGRPWVRIVSCNPAELKDELVPPVFSGYPTEHRAGWDDYWQEYRRALRPVHDEHDEFCRAAGASGLPELDLMNTSSRLNLYVYPQELDYPRAQPLPGPWRALESCVRDEEEAEPWSPPSGEGPLVYLSLGSLGSADVDLMQGLIDALAELDEVRVVVSLGPQHELLRLPEGLTGAEYLPQTEVLRHAGAVITHGGNNTVTECMHFGCPMIVLPLFWDQHDNAQRVAERGFGIRLDTYGHEPAELRAALRRVLGDAALRQRMQEVSARLRSSPGTATAAEAIAQLAAG